MPRGLVYSGASALLSIIGGPTFVRKVGLGVSSAVMTHALLLLGRLRAAALSCLPMRTEYPPPCLTPSSSSSLLEQLTPGTRPRLLSEILMQAHYPMAAAAAGGAPTSRPRSGKLLDFSLVGPVGLLPVLEEYDSSIPPPTSSFDATHAAAGSGNDWLLNVARARRWNPTSECGPRPCERHTTRQDRTCRGVPQWQRERSKRFANYEDKGKQKI